MAEWKKYKFSDFLTRVKTPIIINDLKKYKRVTIKTRHGGVFLRDFEIGVKIGTKKQFVLEEGQFVLSKIDARYGAFGIATTEVDGAIITGNFWAYDFDKAIISIAWLEHFTNSQYFYDFCERASSGITHRKYLDELAFLDNEIHLPPIQNQDEILLGISSKKIQVECLKNELSHQQTLHKQLRQQILQEAIEGKLTTDWRKQNPDVEPASELLARIQAEKEQLIKEKKIKRQKPLPTIEDEEKPFELPEGWVWCRLSNFGQITGGGTPSKGNEEFWNGDIPWVTPKDMKADIIGTTELKITLAGIQNSSAKMIPENSILIVGRSGILKRTIPVSINAFKCTVNQDLKVIIPFFQAMANYIQTMLWGMEKYILDNLVKYGMTVHSLKYTEFSQQYFPLPPLPEQKAIVDKVEKLLAHCDQLRDQITANKSHSDQLMQAVLKEAFSQ